MIRLAAQALVALWLFGCAWCALWVVRHWNDPIPPWSGEPPTACRKCGGAR